MGLELSPVRKHRDAAGPRHSTVQFHGNKAGEALAEVREKVKRV